MTERRHSNHARIAILEQLGPQEDPALPWATFGGDRTDAYTFSVPTAEAADAYIQLQLYDVDTYGHEILLNGDPLDGFDLPPADDSDGVDDTERGDDTEPARITAIAVRRRRRDRGIGRQLVDAAAEQVAPRPLAATFDERVRPFYRACGFEIEPHEGRLRGCRQPTTAVPPD